MSWSHGPVTGGVREIKEALKATYAANPLSEPEKSLRHDAEDALAKIENALGQNFVVNFSASGSQSVDGDGKVTAVTFNVSITPAA